MTKTTSISLLIIMLCTSLFFLDFRRKDKEKKDLKTEYFSYKNQIDTFSTIIKIVDTDTTIVTNKAIIIKIK